MKKLVFATVTLVMAGCSVVSPPKTDTYERIRDELAVGSSTKAMPDAVSAALMPPLSIEVPRPAALQEERFNVAFNNLSAAQFFTAIATGSRYNMLVHPKVSGNITVDLKNVTLFEALDAVRDLYGYDYQVEGNRIIIRPIEMRTRIFHVNYLNSSRRGFSDIRVTSGSSGDIGGSGNTTSTSTATSTTTTSGSNTPHTVETSKIYTSSDTDFWKELRTALEAIIGVERAVAVTGAGAGAAAQQAAAQQAAARAPGTGAGATVGAAGGTPCRGENVRCVVVNPQSGIVVVRAMPDELRGVEAFLKATQLSVDRQVMLEAKIIEVQLNDGFQSGINWATFANFKGGANQVASGMITPGTTLQPLAPGTRFPQPLIGGNTTGIDSTPGLSLSSPINAAGSLFGFAFQATNFAALISFLETQGTVHVLSSPRVATMNNQKAVLKIGVDELFVTNVTAASNQTIGNTTQQQPPSVTLQSYFSGIVLDVTPQIDDRGNITLHIRPSVSQVTQVNKLINLGSQFGVLVLPVPSNNTSETDTVVRGRDGNIIAIGGLMRYASTSDKSQLPTAGDLPVAGALFRNRTDSNQKRELVILIKPTVATEGGSPWAEDIVDTMRRVQQLAPPPPAWPEAQPQK